MQTGNYFQQGDIILEVVAEIKGKKLNHCTLAHGESGHSHTIEQGAELYEENGVMYLKVMDDEVIVKHQEHLPIVIPRGDYKVRRVLEWDYYAQEAKEVRD